MECSVLYKRICLLLAICACYSWDMELNFGLDEDEMGRACSTNGEEEECI
jgi:hypothetical protein